MIITFHATLAYLNRRLGIAALLTTASFAFSLDLMMHLAGIGDAGDVGGPDYLFALLFVFLLVFLVRSVRDAVAKKTDYLILTEEGVELQQPVSRKFGWDGIEKIILFNTGTQKIRISRKPAGAIDILLQDLSETPEEVRARLMEASRAFGFELLD